MVIPSRTNATPRRRFLIQLLAIVVTLQLGLVPTAFGERGQTPDSEIVLAQSDDNYDASETARDHPLEPRYQPREPKGATWFNNSYIFGMTRGLADSTIAPAGKAPLFLFTVPLDIAFLPFAVIGGFFG